MDSIDDDMGVESMSDLYEVKKNPELIDRSVIEAIRQEIEKLPNDNPSYWHTCDVVDREDVLEIIDKHMKGDIE